MLYKENFEETKKYFKAFWEKEIIDRPLIAVKCPKDESDPGTPIHPLYGSSEDKHLEALRLQEEYFSKTDYSFAEGIPQYTCSFGPDQYGGFMGCQLEMGIQTAWAHPCIKDTLEGYNINFDKSENSVYRKWLNYFSIAAKYAEGKFLINMPDLHSNMDALSAMRSPEELCVDLILDPENVERIMKQIRATYPGVVDDVRKAANFEKTGSIGWSPTYCEGKFAVVQCDFSALISPEMVRRFVIPALREETAYLDHCVYHYDGKEALGHVDDILAIPDIDVVQWLPSAGDKRSIYWMDLLHKIQAAGKGLWIVDWTVEEIKNHFKELKPEGVIFSVDAKNRKEAEDLVTYVKKHM